MNFLLFFYNSFLFYFEITSIHNKTKIIEKYIPGTIESNPKLSAYLKHLMNVYNPLFAEDCKIKKRKSY